MGKREEDRGGWPGLFWFGDCGGLVNCPHLTRRQAHFDAVRVRRREREQLRDYALREFFNVLVLLLQNYNSNNLKPYEIPSSPMASAILVMPSKILFQLSRDIFGLSVESLA